MQTQAEEELNDKQLEEMVKQYREKITEITKLLAEEEQLQKDLEKRAEVEKLCNDLKKGLQHYKNQLRMLANEKVTLTKDASGKIAEAYFESESQWFAAYIIDEDEEKQEAEVQWIGVKK